MAWPPTPSQPVEPRFWAKVEKTDGCWNWTGSRTAPGWHGRISVNGRLVMAHRVSWELHYGPVPEGMSVLHACDNAGCVRPDHLMLGTQVANMRDAGQKGRLGAAKAWTACRVGHQFTDANTYRVPRTGRRQCRECRTAADRRRRAA
jgi:hypothetical protein